MNALLVCKILIKSSRPLGKNSENLGVVVVEICYWHCRSHQINTYDWY